MQLPTFDTYCPNTTAANALVFDLGSIRVWYSYKTPVAFYLLGADPAMVVRENDWGPTTGKHLNSIDGGNKKDRVSGEEFERMLLDALGSGVTA